MSDYNDNFQNLVVQSNVLTEAAYDYTASEKKIFYLIANHIHRLEVVNIEKNLIITFSAQELTMIDQNISRIIRKLNDLRKKTIEIKQNNKWVVAGLINYAEYNRQTKTIAIEISHKILPLLWNFSKEFTMYSLNVVLNLESVYAMRFYELCHQWKNTGKFSFSLEDLKKMFLLEKKYTENNGDLISRTVDISQDEISESFQADMSEVYFTYETIKGKGKKIDGLSFRVHTRESAKKEDYIWMIESHLLRIFPKDKKYRSKITEACLQQPGLEKEILFKINQKEQQYSKSDLGAILRTVFGQDYNI